MYTRLDEGASVAAMEEPGSFRMHPAQESFFKGGPRRMIRTGDRSGRRYATELWIRSTAANDEQAELALEDLRTKGIAMLDDKGNRVEHSTKRRFAIVKFDEEKLRGK